MGQETEINKRYQVAKERYQAIGVDTEKALKTLKDIKISMHCWQGDDVKGFLNPDGELTGGIMATGNYPGAAHTLSNYAKIWKKLIHLFLENINLTYTQFT